jgi:hypothetical protein
MLAYELLLCAVRTKPHVSATSISEEVREIMDEVGSARARADGIKARRGNMLE